jgi:hypothetical protein
MRLFRHSERDMEAENAALREALALSLEQRAEDIRRHAEEMRRYTEAHTAHLTHLAAEIRRGGPGLPPTLPLILRPTPANKDTKKDAS